MRCERCMGNGYMREWLSLMGGEMWRDTLCQECNGCGQQSCCQGHEGQPEEKKE